LNIVALSSIFYPRSSILDYRDWFSEASVYKESDDVDVARPFRLCERCMRPTPVNLPQCVNCGAISIQSVVAEEQERVERRYARALFSRATPVTYALLAVNIGVSVLMALVSTGSDDPAALIAFGAKTNELLRSGEWFRLITPIFIHAGPLHLLLNSYALWVVGTQVEKLYGSARFLLIYLLSGVGGVAGSYSARYLWISLTRRRSALPARYSACSESWPFSGSDIVARCRPRSGAQ
jgi:membrane associated rhomboid family serine protease